MNNNECLKCETFGESCCESSKARRDTATSLAKLVHRQMGEIERMKAQVEKMCEALVDLRETGCELHHEDSCCLTEAGIRLEINDILALSPTRPATMKEAAR